MMHSINYLTCDSRVAGDDCYDESDSWHTARDARLDARRDGWRKLKRDGKVIDVCPHCIMRLAETVVLKKHLHQDFYYR